MKKVLFSLLAMLTICVAANANNIKIQNVSVSGTNVTFDISWENSWNSMSNIDLNYPRNWDAAWVFVKVQSNADNLWKHQLLSTSSGHSVTGGVLQVDPVSDGVGVYIRRTNPGSGNVSATATLSMQSLPAGTLNFKVFGIEMVNIPQGNFALNDSSTGQNRFLNYNVTAAAIPGSSLYSGSPALTTNYPTGYKEIYAAKYETSYAQMIDFLNTLTYDQQDNLTDAAPNAAQGTNAFNTGGYGPQNYIEIDTPGINNTKPAVYGCDYNNNNSFNDPNDGQNNTCVIFSVRNAIAFLDWCGLRPMTEMEYEKVCRGTKYNGTPNSRVPGEYAWGTTDVTPYSIASMSYTSTDSERYVGAVVNGRMVANTATTSYSGCRVGSFATNSTGRAASGAGFYGNMDLCGNGYDLVVGVNNTSNPITMIALGDGNLVSAAGPTSGDCNVSGWSDYSATTYWGARGWSWWGTTGWNTYSHVSSRTGVPIAPGNLSGTSINITVRGVR